MEAQRENNAVGQWGYWTTDEVATAEAHGHPVVCRFHGELVF